MEIMKLFFILYSLNLILGNVESRRVANLNTFNVRSYGAKANGRTDDSQAFTSAWNAACSAMGRVKLVIPAGKYLLGPIVFRGPCKNVQSMRIEMQGKLMATTDLNKYKSDEWFEFARVDNLTLTGTGTFDGQGAVSWPFNKCPQNKNCKVLPTSIKFIGLTNAVVDGISSVNSKFFHIAVLSCKNFKASNIKITAPANSPNTDGIHLERNSGVIIQKSKIGTGDDCISVGQGNSDITLTGITCGPGHGISVGSLGRYKDEGDVQGLTVKDCTLSGTSNGVRIKTWENSPGTTTAANMTFENIVMNHVGNPIIIDQTYCPYANCASQAPSRVKIRNIKFRNIRGTSTTPEAVTLRCSRGLPCQDVTFHDVNLQHVGGDKTTATCLNVEPAFSGAQSPRSCVAAGTPVH